jgi:hypothetical protein
MNHSSSWRDGATSVMSRNRTDLTSAATRVGVAGAAVVGVAFGMVRYALGLTLPDVRRELGMSDALLGVVASGTFAGYLAGLLLAVPLAAWKGPARPPRSGDSAAQSAVRRSRSRPPR